MSRDDASCSSSTSTSPACTRSTSTSALGGYARAAQGAARDDARGGAARARGVRACAAAAAPASRWARRRSFIPKGTMDKYLCCNADESEPGTFKDRLLMQKNPHLLIEGCVIGSIAAGANKGFIFIRGEYELQADILDAAVARGLREGLPRRAHPRLRPLLRPRGPPRPGRLHLRRGDRRCSTRSRASAATRASSRRSPPTRASTRGRR